jgi:hypothetical protein
MKTLFALLTMLIPCLVFAASDCNVVEFDDHFEAVCTGDEKAVPAAGQKPASKIYGANTQPEQTRKRVPAPIPEASPDRLPGAPATTDGKPAIQRQGRTKSQQGLEAAKAERLRLISEHQQ